MTSEWIRIYYTSYWDVPRTFVFRHGQDGYYFDCSFDEVLDDYPPDYRVYRIPADMAAFAEYRWENFEQIGERLPEIAVNRLRFGRNEDVIPSWTQPHGRSIHRSVLEILGPGRTGD